MEGTVYDSARPAPRIAGVANGTDHLDRSIYAIGAKVAGPYVQAVAIFNNDVPLALAGHGVGHRAGVVHIADDRVASDNAVAIGPFDRTHAPRCGKVNVHRLLFLGTGDKYKAGKRDPFHGSKVHHTA